MWTLRDVEWIQLNVNGLKHISFRWFGRAKEISWQLTVQKSTSDVFSSSSTSHFSRQVSTSSIPTVEQNSCDEKNLQSLLSILMHLSQHRIASNKQIDAISNITSPEPAHHDSVTLWDFFKPVPNSPRTSKSGRVLKCLIIHQSPEPAAATPFVTPSWS